MTIEAFIKNNYYEIVLPLTLVPFMLSGFYYVLFKWKTPREVMKEQRK